LRDGLIGICYHEISWRINSVGSLGSDFNKLTSPVVIIPVNFGNRPKLGLLVTLCVLWQKLSEVLKAQVTYDGAEQPVKATLYSSIKVLFCCLFKPP